MERSSLLFDLNDYEQVTGKRWEDYYSRLTGVTIPVRNRRFISKEEKARVWAKTNGYCYHCGCPLNPFADFQIDHLIPLSQDGPDNIANEVPSCSACNLSKRSRL